MSVAESEQSRATVHTDMSVQPHTGCVPCGVAHASHNTCAALLVVCWNVYLDNAHQPSLLLSFVPLIFAQVLLTGVSLKWR